MQTCNQIKLALIIGFCLLNILYSDVFSEEILQLDENSDASLQEIMENYLNNRLIWTQCHKEDLSQLPLNDDIIDVLLALKSENITINSWQKLQSESGLNSSEIRAVKMFILINQDSGFASDYKFYNKFVEDSTGMEYYSNSQKFHLHWPQGGFLGGVTDWDKGERNIWDYSNFTLRWPIKDGMQIYAGGYKFNWGYGLVVSNSLFNMRVSRPSRNLKIGSPGFYNTTSSSPAGNFWGTSVSYQKNRWQFYPFWSRRYRDATIEKGVVQSISTTGQHVTEGQIERKNNLLQSHYGIGTVYKFGQNQVGLLGYYTNYSKKYSIIDSRNLALVSLQHQFKIEDWMFSGEYALRDNGGRSCKMGLLLDLDDLTMGAGYRYLGIDYFSDMGSSGRYFSGELQNETGLNFGLAVKIPGDIKLSGYVDFFRRLVPEEDGSHAPYGTETVLSLYKYFEDCCKFWLKYKQINEKYFSDACFQNVKKQIKLKNVLLLSSQIELVTRLVYKQVRSNQFQSGFGMSNAIEMNMGQISIDAGTTNFFTDNFNSRVYLYEPGIPFHFNLPMLYGTGRRFFLTINYRINELFLLYFVCSYVEQKRVKQANWNQKTVFELQFEVSL